MLRLAAVWLLYAAPAMQSTGSLCRSNDQRPTHSKGLASAWPCPTMGKPVSYRIDALPACICSPPSPKPPR